MTEKEVMKFVIERSNDPIIKNPVLREAMNKDLGPRPMFGQGSSVDSAVRTVDPVQDSGNKIEEVLKAYELYRKNRSGKRPMKFKTFFEEYGKENFATGGQAGQLVSNTVDGSRPGYAGDETFLVKVGKPLKVNNVIEQEFIEVTGSKNRPETYKKTGVKKTLYKPQIVVGNKTVLTTDFGTKDAATTAVEKYRIKNPIKNAPPDLDTLDEKKKKKYLDKRERSAKISKQGGVESFETGNKTIHKGHSQNIDNPDVPIKPSNIIYTPQKINQSMAGSEGKNKYTDLDYKIDVAEDKIKDIKKSNMSGAKKKVELEKLDTKLMKYVDDSNGYKTVTLSGGNTYGEIFQKSKSMDMFDEFPDMTEKETKKFVNQYFNDQGKLKDKWTKGNVSSVDKANIQKSYVFLENIKNAKTNAKQKGGLLKILQDAKVPCIKGEGGQCNSIEDYKKGFNDIVNKAASGDRAAVSKANTFLKRMRKLKPALKATGYGILGEIGFVVPFAVSDYASGESWNRILGNAMDLGFGPMIGQSEQEEINSYLPEGSNATAFQNVQRLSEDINKLETGEEIPGYSNLYNKLENRPMAGLDPFSLDKFDEQSKQNRINEMTINFEKDLQPFLTNGEWDQAKANQAAKEMEDAKAQKEQNKQKIIEERKASGIIAEDDYLQNMKKYND
jgi:hypothetical protein